MIAVSIIIPFYNRAEYFERLFNSLYKIREDNIEIVFVDNNSNIKTKRVIQSYIERLKDKTPLCIKIITEQKPGAPAARNAGLDSSTGEYIYFFDSDDELSPEMPMLAYNKAKQSNADLVALRTNIFIGKKKIVKKMIKSEEPHYQIICNNLATQSVLLKRSFAIKYARWNENLFYWNDLEWGLRILLSKPKVSWLQGSYHTIHVHSNSITGASFSSNIKQIIYAHKIIQDDILKYSCNKIQRKRLLRYLNFRIAIYAGHVCRESNANKAKNLLLTVDDTGLTPLIRLKIKLLYFLSRMGVPGLWRLI